MKRTFIEMGVPACMQDEIVPLFDRWCAIAASHMYNAADEGIAKDIQHPSVSNTYCPRFVTVRQKYTRHYLEVSILEWCTDVHSIC